MYNGNVVVCRGILVVYIVGMWLCVEVSWLCVLWECGCV